MLQDESAAEYQVSLKLSRAWPANRELPLAAARLLLLSPHRAYKMDGLLLAVACSSKWQSTEREMDSEFGQHSVNTESYVFIENNDIPVSAINEASMAQNRARRIQHQNIVMMDTFGTYNIKVGASICPIAMLYHAWEHECL